MINTLRAGGPGVDVGAAVAVGDSVAEIVAVEVAAKVAVTVAASIHRALPGAQAANPIRLRATALAVVILMRMRAFYLGTISGSRCEI
jgi:hypothetical protein